MSTLDTHTIVEELITANVPKKQAEVFVKRFVIKEELTDIEKEHSELATKADLLEVKTELKADIARLESKIEKIETNINWLKTISIANFTLLLGAVISTLFSK
jgi:hypothetical protein